eukprot:g70418.t1
MQRVDEVGVVEERALPLSAVRQTCSGCRASSQNVPTSPKQNNDNGAASTKKRLDRFLALASWQCYYCHMVRAMLQQMLLPYVTLLHVAASSYVSQLDQELHRGLLVPASSRRKLPGQSSMNAYGIFVIQYREPCLRAWTLFSAKGLLGHRHSTALIEMLQ